MNKMKNTGFNRSAQVLYKDLLSTFIVKFRKMNFHIIGTY